MPPDPSKPAAPKTEAKPQASKVKEPAAPKTEAELVRMIYQIKHAKHGAAICDGRQIDEFTANGWDIVSVSDQ